MIANSKSDQLISAGRGKIFCMQTTIIKLVLSEYRPNFYACFFSADNIIKIWRLYPYAQESLASLMSFYCAHTPVHMTVMKGKLAVAFQEHTTATYNVVMYNLDKKSLYYLLLFAFMYFT